MCRQVCIIDVFFPDITRVINVMSSSGKRVVTMVKYTKTKAPKFRQTAVWSSYTMLGGAIVVCRNLGALVISIILVISHRDEGLVVWCDC